MRFGREIHHVIGPVLPIEGFHHLEVGDIGFLEGDAVDHRVQVRQVAGEADVVHRHHLGVGLPLQQVVYIVRADETRGAGHEVDGHGCRA